MPSQVDLTQRAELRDGSGRTVGYYVPASEFEARFEKDIRRLHELEVEQQEWDQVRKQLTEERDQLRAELTQVRAERDQYLKAVYALTQEEFNFRKEDILAPHTAGETFYQLIEELEQARGA